MTFERGQVVALRRNAAGLVLGLTQTHVQVVPIGGYNGPPPHRAEVRVEDASEITALGVSIRFPVVRCQMPFEIALTKNALAVIGNASTALMAKVAATMRREVENRAMEARMQFYDLGRTAMPVRL